MSIYIFKIVVNLEYFKKFRLKVLYWCKYKDYLIIYVIILLILFYIFKLGIKWSEMEGWYVIIFYED